MGDQVAVEPKVRLVWHTPDPKRMIALAARMCYSAKDVSKLQEDLLQVEIDRMVNHILTVRHVSVLRHVVFAFTIEGVSRSFSHQFVRHHVGVDVEQRSQHYRREKQFSFNFPDSVCDRPQAGEIYVEHMEKSQEVYDHLINLGVDKAEARQVLPNACETQMMVTMNLNAIMNVVSQRACRLNTPEILNVAVQIRKLVGQVMPEAREFLGPTCWTTGVCYEGEQKYMKSCQRPWQSPTVLWSKDFPRVVKFVGLRAGKHETWETHTETYNGTVKGRGNEPTEKFQTAKNDDGR